LLPDTPINGAKAVAEKFKHKLTESLGENASLLDFVVSSYPEALDFMEHNIHSKDTKSRVSSKPTIFKMEYSSNSRMSDAITVDPSLILDLEKIGIWFDWNLVVKRLIDILGALVGIVIFSPLMLIIAAAIRITSKGPVLFRQERLGYQGRKFDFLKFRSMYMDNDENIHREFIEKLIRGDHGKINSGSEDRPYYKMKNDPRVTPLGRILRKSSLDELPQFFNILMGQMSLVGPRPPIPYELNSYKNWHRKRIIDVKPGITGLWQVKGRSKTTFEEMVRLDLQYAKKRSLWLDFKILFRTFKAVFSAKGAD
jgi:exopolysaccharide biosynthesis polyprenyl glycosylphosphotransferase